MRTKMERDILADVDHPFIVKLHYGKRLYNIDHPFIVKLHYGKRLCLQLLLGSQHDRSVKWLYGLHVCE